MSIPGDIIQLLRSSECAKISLTLCNIAIDGGGYKAVADKIDDGRIRVLTSPDVPPDSAIYERIRNVFIVNASISRTLIVHEATHAINDLKRKTSGCVLWQWVYKGVSTHRRLVSPQMCSHRMLYLSSVHTAPVWDTEIESSVRQKPLTRARVLS